MCTSVYVPDFPFVSLLRIYLRVHLCVDLISLISHSFYLTCRPLAAAASGEQGPLLISSVPTRCVTSHTVRRSRPPRSRCLSSRSRRTFRVVRSVVSVEANSDLPSHFLSLYFCYLLPSFPFPSLSFPSLLFPSLPFLSLPSLSCPSFPFPSHSFPFSFLSLSSLPLSYLIFLILPLSYLSFPYLSLVALNVSDVEFCHKSLMNNLPE